MTFSQLKTQIALEINRTVDDTRIGVAINQVLHNIERKYNLNYMIAIDTSPVTLATGAYELAFPTNYKSMIWMKYLDGTELYPVIQEAETVCLNAYNDYTLDTGEPLMFCSRWESSKFLIRPTADKNYSIYRKYFKKSADLVTTSNENNWLTDNAWEVLFYGALVEMSAYYRDKEGIAYWMPRYREAITDQIKTEIAESESATLPTVKGAY